MHWRNYEAGYDVAELEPADHMRSTYVLQEYFVSVAALERFAAALGAILRKHDVNTVNVSIRHASTDRETVMSWTRGETFAFVLYYKQETSDAAKESVAIWTRELVDAALAVGSTYYLPYQMHATDEQFHRAYPRAKELFALKRAIDPHYRLRGVLWDRYYLSRAATATHAVDAPLFHAIYDDTRRADRFHAFLGNVFDIVPADGMHALIKQCTSKHEDDKAIYRAVQNGLPAVTLRLAMLTHALPSLARKT
ncbi:oxidoreductase, FAD-binding [Candidatus Paraburkholderia calva]|nr:oxidoreductase, FAD-binding [Candidatus Paraburkholderia calva]